MPLFDLNLPAPVLARRLLEAPEQARTELAQAEFSDPDRALRNLEDLADPRAFGQLPGPFFSDLMDAPDPDMALNNFDRLVNAVFGRSAFLRQLESRPEMSHLLLNVLGGSQFMADILVRDPESLYWLTENHARIQKLGDRAELSAAFDAAIGALKDRAHKLNAVRRAARRELLRIGVGDLAGGRPIQYVAADLSILADVCLQKMIDILMPELEARYGVPRQADGERAAFAVIGLGKLGGMELNFSSDIDLMFAYSEDGKTDADGQSVSNQEFFTRLSEHIVKTATETTAEGFLYRIDMRLRPDGAAGALTMPLSGYEGYYMRRGELWERQMLIKARPCAGSAELGNRFLQMIQPFVYPRHFEASPTVEIHRIKQRIEAQIGRKGQGDTHLKLRSGGIRDIEFTVQCLQLLVGRIHQSARSDNTLEAIRQLRRVAALSPEEADALREAYVFFRRLEHRMQMMHNRSDYILPDGDHALRVMARTMGYDTAEAYRKDLQQHLMGVQTVYANVFAEIPESEGRSIGALVEMPSSDPEALRLLSEIGFARPEEAHRNLIYMAFGHVPRIKGTQSRKSFTELAPALMHTLQNSADPDQGLGNLERLVSAYGAGDMLFRMLTTNRGFRDLLLSLCVGSQYLVQVIVRNPGLLDWLIRPEVLHQNPGAEALRTQLREQVAQTDEGDARIAVLNRLKNRELLRIGTRDLLDLTNTFETFEALTILADAVVQTVYEMVCEKLMAQRGTPRNERGDPATFAVVGLGKMGGRELNFGSDLDLVFVYSEEGETDGNRSNLQYFIELAQQMTAILEQNTPYGKLYPVDARLRPEGGNAMLTLSYDAYDQYLTHRASTWERLALSRSRVVAGDVAFGQQLLARFERFIVGDGFSEEETTAMCDIRRRMEKKGEARTQVQPSIKTDPGGIVDIEFIAQILQLKHAVQKPDLRSANTLESLDKLAASGYLATEDATHLKQAFAFLRTVEKIMRRQNEQARTRLPADKRALTALARAVDSDTPEAFVEALTSDMAKTRALFERLIGNV